MSTDQLFSLAGGFPDDSEAALSFSMELIENWRRDRNPDTCDVLADYPGLARCKQAVVDLAYEEFCLRIESGEELDWVGFCQKFPAVEDSLQRRIAVHLAFDENPSLFADPVETLWPRVGSTFFGYKIIGEIGRGSFARAYQAKEISLGGRLVVIKVCMQGSHEANTLGKLTHRNIIPIHSVQEVKSGLTIICMPFMGMFTLADLLESTYGLLSSKARPVSYWLQNEAETSGTDESAVFNDRVNVTYVNYVLETGIQLCEALHYLHAKEILHLDLKPSNILIDHERKPVLLDFNLSFDRAGLHDRTGGTLCYMSPEQRRVVFGHCGNVRQLDAQTDVFSMGVILFELFNGKLPYTEESLKEVKSKDVQPVRRPWNISNRSLTKGIMKIVDTCLQVESEKRYASASELAAALRLQQTWFRRGFRLLQGEPGFLKTLLFSSTLLVTALVFVVYATEVYRIFF